MENKIRKPRLINAKAMSSEFPDSFYYWEDEISIIKVGDIVKVCNGYDRFWVILTRIDGKLLEGSVNSYLVGNILSIKAPSYNYGDIISFKKDHIYEVWDQAEFDAQKKALVK